MYIIFFTLKKELIEYEESDQSSCAEDWSNMLISITYVCVCRGLFGEQCTLARVHEELLGYSDYSLHSFALQHPKRFGSFALDAKHVMDSGKFRTLAELLPRLQVCAASATLSENHGVVLLEPSNIKCSRKTNFIIISPKFMGHVLRSAIYDVHSLRCETSVCLMRKVLTSGMPL